MSPKFRVTNNFKKRAAKKPKHMQERIAECIKALAADPKNPKLRTHKMQGHKGVWEAYIDNDGNRVTFEWDASVIVLRNNCNHDMLYRNP